jgi:hypothetical protein
MPAPTPKPTDTLVVLGSYARKATVDVDQEKKTEPATGSAVRARWARGYTWYDATIQRIHPDGSADLRYPEDDEKEPKVPEKYWSVSRPPPKKEQADNMAMLLSSTRLLREILRLISSMTGWVRVLALVEADGT